MEPGLPAGAPARPTMLDDHAIASLLAERTRFHQLVHLRTCESTQAVAAAAPRDGDAIFWADHQTHGRGRQRREWHDEPGADLMMTMRVTVALPRPLALAAALPVAVLQAIEPLARRPLRVKWPNDLLLDGRKLSGVLIDAGVSGADSWLIGIGVNCNRVRFPRDLEATATSLALATGHEVDRGNLLLAIAERVDALLRDLAADRLRPWLAALRDRLGLLGRRIVVDAGTTLEGVLADPDFENLVLDGGRAVPLATVRGLRAAH